MTGVPFSDGREREEVDRILSTLYSDEERELWWKSPQALLLDKTPTELFAEGKGDMVLHILRCLDEGAYL